MICRTCRRPIREVAPGRYGHVENPTFMHHYPKPVRVKETEAEKREGWGK